MKNGKKIGWPKQEIRQKTRKCTNSPCQSQNEWFKTKKINKIDWPIFSIFSQYSPDMNPIITRFTGTTLPGNWGFPVTGLIFRISLKYYSTSLIWQSLSPVKMLFNNIDQKIYLIKKTITICFSDLCGSLDGDY